ncbi:phenylacetate--CoA ligase family protein [Algibacter amylolyticus]|uniref:Phenylacetate--CoA ligase family protein n=1 Tax=Algibacter amylolyticus TaxID=1608400 RepID=A0A5M7BFT0_9FLAO|nr:phenylacetate--CoA ligase family protein [Algibacter amylolyticus]KAA5827408.1 phenylacetate--CoA ligase family protein [Algibacter amylolyticus]MBB5266600.1 phenylacetate-CoA ligase [Algibacter amylolyticus]TSJ81653.1 phenylacetate--CoA ligase family protein [Algibacter amylolyticus]
MNLFDFSLQLNGFPIKEARTVLKSIQDIDEKDFAAHVEEKKQDIVAFHLKNNPYYKTFLKDIDTSDWNNIPVLTKQDLQKPLEERLTKHYTKFDIYINKTSGSSGTPFVFAKDKFSHALTWAIIQNRFGWYNLDFNTSKQARFYGIPLDKKGYYKERFKDKLSRRFRFSVFDLSAAAFEKHLQKFTKTPFEYLNGYTSSIVQFAKFLQDKNLVLKTICPTLKACIVTSEMLFDHDKKLMETQFGVPIINEYGASELDLIAFENPNGNWQVNSESLYVEILDDNNSVLPYGEEGRIVITSLYNKAHPFIRYDIGDVGILSTKSTAKTPILEKLIGRTNDIAILASGKKAAGLTFYYITKSIIEDDGNVKEFIIEQHKLDTFKIIYVSTEPLLEEKIKTITIEMENYLEKGLQIQFERQDKLIRSKSGKLKQFTSYLNQDI